MDKHLTLIEGSKQTPKEIMLTIIKNNGITTRESIRNSYHELYEIKSSWCVKNGKITNRQYEITTPKFTDYTDIQQAIMLAHELGHYYMYQKYTNYWQTVLITSKQKHVLYRHEKMAWDEAYDLLNNLNLLSLNDNEIENEFYRLKEKCLKSYKPKQSLSWYIAQITLIKPTYFLIKNWFIAYLIIGMFYVFVSNDIPIPFLSLSIQDIQNNNFYQTVNNLFGLFIVFHFTIWFIKTMKRNISKI